MDQKIICDAEDLTAIADAVRASTGSTNTYNVPELSAAAVSMINSGGGVLIDDTLTIEGAAADAKAAGDAINKLSEEIAELMLPEPDIYTGEIVSFESTSDKKVEVIGESADQVTLIHQGKNFAPFIGSPYTTYGVTFKPGEKGRISIKGAFDPGTSTAKTAQTYLIPYNSPVVFPAGNYIVSSDIPVDGTTSGVNVVLKNEDGTTKKQYRYAYAGNNIAFTLDAPTPIAIAVVINNLTAGAALDMTGYIQIERGEVASEYEQYSRTVYEGEYDFAFRAKDGFNLLYTEERDVLTVTVSDVATDATLTQMGQAADAEITGEAIRQVYKTFGISPQDYGAVGDGIADDTAAIQNCINANNTVFLPDGTYRITTPLFIPSGRTIMGHNRQNTRIKCDNCDAVHFVDGASSGRFSGLGFIGDNTNHKGFVFARDVQHWNIEDIAMTQFGDVFFDMVDKGYVGVIWIRNCEFSRGGSSCIDASKGGNSQVNSIDIQNCEITQFPNGNGINITGVRHSIIGNTIQNTVNGINIQASLGEEGSINRNAYAITILSNYFEGNTGNFVRIVPLHYYKEDGGRQFGIITDLTVSGNYGLMPNDNTNAAVKFEIDGTNPYENQRLLAHGSGFVKRFIYYGNQFRHNNTDGTVYVDGGNLLHSDSIVIQDASVGDRSTEIEGSPNACINMGNATVLSMTGNKTKVVKIRDAFTEGTATVTRDNITLQPGASLLIDVDNDGIYKIEIPVEMTAGEGTESSTITINGQLATGEVVKTYESDLTADGVVIGAAALITDIATDTDHASKEFVSYEIAIASGSNTLIVGNPVVKCVQ